ncbi:MAG: glycosyltransferase family 2 protein [Chloroflexota bacterium]
MITVGVAAFNSTRVLPRLLDSLLAQQYPRDGYEIVVADNGSADGTPAMVERYAGRGPVRLIWALHRRGPAAARNAMVGAARGEIVAFTDHDCVAHPRWLAEIEAGFADPTVGCVAGAILPGEQRTATERYYARQGILSQEMVLRHPVMPYAQTANAAFRRLVFEQAGGFDEEMITCEDADVLWRMQLRTGFRLLYRPEAVVWHHHRSSPGGLLRQTTGWGIGHALLRKKHPDLVSRDPAGRLLADYRRVLGLASLTLRRWVGVKAGMVGRDSLEEAYLSLLFDGGLKLGRLKGSIANRVFYP